MDAKGTAVMSRLGWAGLGAVAYGLGMHLLSDESWLDTAARTFVFWGTGHGRS